MKTVTLKTNIHCSSCVAKVTPVLDEKFGQGNWSVNTLDPKKILTVNGESLSEEEVILAVKNTGYNAEKSEA